MNKRLKPLNRFDTYTGDREITITFVCPQRRWYKLGHWSFDATSEFEAKDD